jgi:recombination associated protein RdgC
VSTEHAFLGEEFLTWLWFRIETCGGDFDLGRDRTVGVSFDDYIAFAPRDDDETEHTLKKGSPSRCAEASAALHNGRRLRRAKLILGLGESVWSLTLDGPSMNLLGVKLPEDDPDCESAAERSVDRIRSFLEVQELVAGLYRVFLEQRLEPDYLEHGAAAQAQWMASR